MGYKTNIVPFYVIAKGNEETLFGAVRLIHPPAMP